MSSNGRPDARHRQDRHPRSYLLKPSRLPENEFEIMKRHTLIGYEILKDSPSQYLQMGAVIALAHHECFNGSGYPHGLKAKRFRWRRASSPLRCL